MRATIAVICAAMLTGSVIACGKGEPRDVKTAPDPASHVKTPKRTYTQSESHLLQEACAIMDTLATPVKNRSDLEKLVPELNIERYAALLKTISESAPVSGGCQMMPPEVRTLTKREHETMIPLFNELQQQMTALKKAGAQYYEGNPRDLKQLIIAGLPSYMIAYSIRDVTDYETYQSLWMQDTLPQVPEAARDLPTIGEFVNLVELILFGNNMTDFPIDCARLTKLKILYLSGNAFSAIPENLLKCASLVWLDLSENQIEEISPAISRLKNLRYLDLSGNRLTDEQFAELKKQLPECAIKTKKKIYTSEEKEMNLVIDAPEFVVLGDGILLDNPASLPRDKGTHTVAGTATIDKHADQQVVIRIDSVTGDSTVFRKEGEDWIDVTAKSTDVIPRFKLEK